MTKRLSASAHIAVAVCTCGRNALLAQTLIGLAGQEFRRMARPKITALVVDNLGDPETASLCERLTGPTFDVRYAVETERGVASARNRALRMLAELDDADLAFIDDDEVPDPNWLERLLLCCRSGEVAIVHGAVLPRYEVEPPAWIVEGQYFHTPREDQPTQRRTGTSWHCGNVLIRRAALIGADGKPSILFDTRFNRLGGEDWIFFDELIRKRGLAHLYCPEAVVHEFVPASRMRLGYLLRRRYVQGYARCVRKGRTRLQGLRLFVKGGLEETIRFVRHGGNWRRDRPLHHLLYLLAPWWGHLAFALKLAPEPFYGTSRADNARKD